MSAGLFDLASSSIRGLCDLFNDENGNGAGIRPEDVLAVMEKEGVYHLLYFRHGEEDD